jgi:NAD(P)-dependent dehydrogenase (short-subunit alcohol dehydrogenase family)
MSPVLLLRKATKVALAARKLKDETNEEGQLTIRGDFADPSSMTAIFAKVREVFGNPSVVVYNGELSGRAVPVYDGHSLSKSRWYSWQSHSQRPK